MTNSSKGYFGNSVRVLHPDGTVIQYSHLSKVFVTEGQEVVANEAIGQIGRTGIGVTGPHLHYAVYTALNNAYYAVSPQGDWSVLDTRPINRMINHNAPF